MRTRSWREFACCVSLLFPLALSGFAAPRMGGAPPIALLPENWEAREELRGTIFAPVREAAARPRSIVLQIEGAPRVLFRTETQSGALYLVFANPEGNGFPLAGAGTFVIKRSLEDGRFLQAKVFVQDDPGCYVRMFPQGDRTAMDIVLFDEPYQTQVLLPLAFDRLLTAPFSRIVDLTARAVDWSLVLSPAPGPGDERIVRALYAIRARLPGLRDMDDGAMDSESRMVYIATGASAGKGGFNCSGFAKWVVDGFFAPLAGRAIDIAALKSRDAARWERWSARYEEELDPYFGLDWSRGLARSLAQARTGVAPADEQINVRDGDRVPYVTDAGYPVTRLRQLLYFLARRDPGTIYLGSVNAASAEASQQGTPTLRRHHHVVVLFPYFDGHGRFQTAVMERNMETSLDSLDRRFGKEYVHLVRLDSTGEFSPPQID